MPVPHDGDAGQRAVDAVSSYFVGDASIGDALDKLCRAALDAVPPAALAGISMTVDARTGTYVFTDPEAVEIDRAQYDTGDGPCIDALTTGRRVLIDSTRSHPSYPAFCTVAERHGMLSTLSAPLVAGSHVVGALNLYAQHERAFADSSLATAESFATQAAYLLLEHQAYWDAKSLSENLEQAMQSRAEIEQAKGIIMASTGCSADAAFDRLREQSQHENRKLRDVAREIVQRAQRGGARD